MIPIIFTRTRNTRGRHRSQRLVIGPPWSRFISGCRRFWHPPRPDK
eukprot:COSAG02_NODE_59408_length_274_cov_0.868571_1_plen_45_part_10